MTIDTIATSGQAAVVQACGAEDTAGILAAMLDLLGRGEYEDVEPYQLEHAAARIADDLSSCAVALVDGHLAGWVVPMEDDLTVLPPFRRRGIGRQLLAAGHAIARAGGRESLRLWVRHQPGSEAFASACGLRYTSSLWQMRLAGSGVAEAPEPVFPAGTAIRSLRPGEDEPRFVALVNRIFLDHPTPITLTEEEVRRVHERGFDPRSILIVEDLSTREMVGFCRVVCFTASDGSPAGEIRLLGVDRPWRGRGLGRAVTSWGVAELRRRGAEAVVLAVEGENAGAQRLYAGLGFQVGAEWRYWTIPATDGPAD
ncbi:MAG TPA: GNAT family N-acetyltransferase [Candidatus Limnocylindrales bacterium]